MLAGRGIVRAGYVSKGKGTVRAGYRSKQSKKGKGFLFKDFSYHPIIQQTLKYKRIIKMNLDLMDFILEIIYLIK